MDAITSQEVKQPAIFELANFNERLIAFFLDRYIWLATAFPFVALIFYYGYFLGSFFIFLLSLFSLFVTFTFYNGIVSAVFNGQTIGKKLMGIKIVKEDGSPIGFWLSIRRAFGFYGRGAWGLNNFEILLNSGRQSERDRILETLVVKTKERPPAFYKIAAVVITILITLFIYLFPFLALKGMIY